MKTRPVIGITQCSSYNNYHRWIEAEGVEVIQLSYSKNNLADLQRCHGVVMTGGEDVDPEFYHKIEYRNECEGINRKRDEFEWRVLEHLTKQNVPLLGICRGLQITNVFFGGTLIPDLVSRQKDDHTKLKKGDRYHSVSVIKDSQLHHITGLENGEINSSHHQAADQLGEGLIINSLSADQVIEGLERVDANKAYLMLVQWHPERTKNAEGPFSKNIKESFIKAVENSRRGAS